MASSPAFRVSPLLRALLGALILNFTCVHAAAAQADPAEEAGATAEADDEEARAADSRLPRIELTQQILFQFLLSEIAGSRGQLNLSVQGYLDLARRTGDPRIAQRATEIAVFARQSQAAQEAAKLWVSSDPQSVQALQTLAGVLAGSPEGYAEVEAPLAKLLASDAKLLPVRLLELNRFYSRNPDKLAVNRSVERLTEPYLNLAEAHFARAFARLGAGDNPGAIAAADAARALRPDWEPAVLMRAQATPKAQQAEAMEMLREFGVRYPKAREARLAYARWLVSERRLSEARREFQRMLDDFPADNDVAYGVAILALQAGDLSTAEVQLRRLIAANYRDTDLLRLQLGQLLEEGERDTEAITIYESVGSGAQFAPAHVRAAVLRAEGGDLEGARGALRRLATEDAQNAPSYQVAEAHLLRDAGQPEQGFALLNEALRARPDQQELLYESALLAERIGLHAEVERRLRRLIELRPDHAHAYNALGYSYVERNLRLDEADKLIARALELSPDDGFIVDSLGWLRYRQGRVAEAAEALRRAYSLRRDPEIAAHLGEVLWMQGQRDEALRLWDEALKTAPDNAVLIEVKRRFAP